MVDQSNFESMLSKGNLTLAVRGFLFVSGPSETESAVLPEIRMG